MTGRKYIKGCISDTDQVFGFIIIKTPKNPKTTASRRLIPTFSPRSGIDKRVIKIGATKKRAVAVASGSVAMAEKKIMLQKKIASKYGYKLVDHKLELYGVKVDKKNE